MKKMDRRQFIKYGSAGAAALIVGSNLQVPWQGPKQAYAATPSLNFTITDAIKQMHTHIPKNNATCYFWLFKEATLPAEVPGPQVYCTVGDTITLTVKNLLDENHAFAIPDLSFDTGPIAPGATYSGTFTATKAGVFLYYDDLNAPVNRVMGLHGAIVVMPQGTIQPFGWSPYPYDPITPGVKQLYDDFGTAPWWPGLAWHEGDSNIGGPNPSPPFRQYIWLVHQASPVLFAEVGNFRAGQNYPAAQFMEAFLNDPFIATSNDGRANTPKLDRFNRKPHFFTIDGQSGHFSHNNAAVTPMNRVGEPSLIRVINAGLWSSSMHIHANHVYVTAVDHVVSENPLWVDVFTLHPMGHMDYTLPFMRPPDIPNARGLGRGGSGDAALATLANPPFPGFPGAVSHPTWPPTEEFTLHHPKIGTFKKGFLSGTVDIAQRQSPLCFPMHDHSEPSQSTQGGNYNTALISGLYFIGDQNGPLKDFPIDADFQMMLDLGGSTSRTGPAAGKTP